MRTADITEEQLQYIYESRLMLSNLEMAEIIGCSKTTISRLLRKKGWQITKEQAKAKRIKKVLKPITAGEKEFIITHIEEHSIKWISKQLKRTSSLILKEAHNLGFTNLLQAKSQNSKFKNNHIPWHKGKKINIPRHKGMFKKGSIPHNAKPKGYEKIQHVKKVPYIMIKVEHNRKMTLKHKYLWEKHYGEIPEGYLVSFKDGNTLNCVLDNLELISKTENMLRNSRHDFPKEVIPAMVGIVELKKAIKDGESKK